MLTIEDLELTTGIKTDVWSILLEEAERYGYDDEKTMNLAKGFKMGIDYATDFIDKELPGMIAGE
jgi:hypothetical protein